MKLTRKFVQEKQPITCWDDIKPYYTQLTDEAINSADELRAWWQKRSELEAVLQEEIAWRYIRMTCDTTREDYENHFNQFVNEIEPHIQEASNLLDKKTIALPYCDELEDTPYAIPLREIRKDIELFRKESIPLMAQMQTMEQEYGKIAGAMTIHHDDKELTLQQAAAYLKSQDPAVRKEVFDKIKNRRLEDSAKLDQLLDKLIQIRQEIARNAGYADYYEYKFHDLGRFDYTPTHCQQFHKAVATHVRPLLNEIVEERRAKMKLETLHPWDLDVDISGKPALKPFEDSEDLVKRTVACFSEIRPKYGKFIQSMKKEGFLDLDSRIGKAPGGYNYPLYESNMPFIFMNSAAQFRDLTTMVHEGGHAIHSFLSADLELTNFKELPSEIAELASMSMELISMEHWHHFFDNPDDLARARTEQLEDIISTLCWVATVDKFQQWLYTTPHTADKRRSMWTNIYQQFNDSVTDWDGNEEYLANLWQKQLHIFEVPLYYIEYGIAQLGALGVWKNYHEDRKKALDNYEKALKAGYTCSLPELYQKANVAFDFSTRQIQPLMKMWKKEMQSMHKE